MDEKIVATYHPQYIPYIPLFARLVSVFRCVLLDNIPFPNQNKEAFRNRNRIRIRPIPERPEGWMWLTVPVKRKAGQLLNEVEIADNTRWSRKHWGSIARNYARAEYFCQYAPFLEACYMQKPWKRSGREKLIDINIHLLYFLLDALEIPRDRVALASEIGILSNDRICRLIEICKKLDANWYLAGPMEWERMDEREKRRFADAGIDVQVFTYEHPVYRQCFEPFLKNMSALDLVLNEGPQSCQIVRQGLP